jgi:Uma2 family endonuclease
MSSPAMMPPPGGIEYPESDGKSLADTSKQFTWIILLYGNLAALYHDREDVFVCGNQNWYPVEGHPEIVNSPDVYVVFGRPKGHRRSWKQWEEDNTPMTVAFEVNSPTNTNKEMEEKRLFYESYGVEEYYLYDPDRNTLKVWLRRGSVFRRVKPFRSFTSPRLGVRFDLTGEEMVVYHPDGVRFLTFEQFYNERKQAQRQAKAEQLASTAKQRADTAEHRAIRLAQLIHKAQQNKATPGELAELERLVNELDTER